jgi:hypothetical protein
MPESGSATQRGRHPEEKERPRGHLSTVLNTRHTVLKIQFMYSQKRNLHCLSPNFHFHVSVSELYIPQIGPHIFLQQNVPEDSLQQLVVHLESLSTRASGAPRRVCLQELYCASEMSV